MVGYREMRKAIIRALISVFAVHKYYCDCGYKTNNSVEFVAHIAKHSNDVQVDMQTGLLT